MTRSNAAWLIILLCGAVMFIDGFNTQMISYMVPRIAAEWGLSRALFGPIFSAALAGLVVGYLAISPLSDRFGHKRVVVLSTAAFAMISLASVWTRHVSDLMVLRFLTGVGLGAATPSAVALTGEHSPRHWRATLVLAIYCGFSLGFVAAGVAASSLMIAYGWRSMFWAGGVAPLLLVPALVRYLPAPQPTSVGVRPTRKNVRASVAQLFDRHTAPGTLLLWLVFVINLGEFYAFQSWLPTILTDRAYPPQTIVTATALMTVGGIAVALIVGPAMDRIGPYVTLGLLYVLGFPFVALLGPALNAPAWVLFVATFLSGFCVSGGQKSAIALAVLFYPANVRSTGVGWALGIGRLGGLAGPLLLGGALTSGVMPGEAFLAMSVLLLVTAAAVYIMGRKYVRTVEHAGQSERAVGSGRENVVLKRLLLITTIATMAASVAAQSPARRTSPPSKGSTGPRTPWGDPDLHGTYTNKYEQATPLERPAELEGRRLGDMTAEELRTIMRKREQDATARAPFVGGDPEGKIGAPRQFREISDIQQGTRAWLIIDPPDGKIPAVTPEAQRRIAALPTVLTSFSNGVFNGPEDFSLWERCFTRGFPGSMMPGIYGNSYEIVQTPDHVAIRYEMIHETRVIPLGNRPHVAASIAFDMGDARGHWDGDTLVVETTNFRQRSAYRNANAKILKLTERFTRTGPGRLEWAVTVDDPSTWVRPWTFSLPLTSSAEDPVYEYACHEGNYAMSNLLSGSRAVERAAATPGR